MSKKLRDEIRKLTYRAEVSEAPSDLKWLDELERAPEEARWN